jgi:hypothetical protein
MTDQERDEAFEKWAYIVSFETMSSRSSALVAYNAAWANREKHYARFMALCSQQILRHEQERDRLRELVREVLEDGLFGVGMDWVARAKEALGER